MPLSISTYQALLWLQYLAAELPAGTTADPTSGDRKVWAIIAYVMTALTVLLFLFTMVMLRRIKIAVATLKVCLRSLPPVYAACSGSTLGRIFIHKTMTSCLLHPHACSKA